jgi:replicative DNA helicase
MNTQPLPDNFPLVNLDAEQRLLGAILHSNKSYDQIAGKLTAEHFAEPLHGRIFTAMAGMIEKGGNANPVTLRNLFETDKTMGGIGGPAYLARLAGSMVTTNTAQYGSIISDLWARRRAVGILAEGMDRVSTPLANESGADAIANIGKELDSVLEGSSESSLAPVSRGLAGAMDGIQAAYKEKGKLQGVTTGISDLDHKLGGLRPGRLYILAGRPSMGKSSLSVNISLGAARAGHGVALFSAEMPEGDLGTFMLGSLTGLPIDQVNNARLDDNDFHRLTEAQRDLGKLPIWINDRPKPSVSDMRAQARVLSRKRKLGVIVVDHIGIIRADRRYDNRVAEITEITGSLKQLAKETNTAVIALSQLSREVEKREDKRPMLSDLRDSGSIEQDADTVMFLYRDEYYLEREQPKATAKAEAKYAHAEALERSHNRCEVIFAKHRFGPIGKVELYYDDSICRFGNVADAPKEQLERFL